MMHFMGGVIIPRQVLCPWRAHLLASTLPAVARATAACFVRCGWVVGRGVGPLRGPSRGWCVRGSPHSCLSVVRGPSHWRRESAGPPFSRLSLPGEHPSRCDAQLLLLCGQRAVARAIAWTREGGSLGAVAKGAVAKGAASCCHLRAYRGDERGGKRGELIGGDAIGTVAQQCAEQGQPLLELEEEPARAAVELLGAIVGTAIVSTAIVSTCARGGRASRRRSRRAAIPTAVAWPRSSGAPD